MVAWGVLHAILAFKMLGNNTISKGHTYQAISIKKALAKCIGSNHMVILAIMKITVSKTNKWSSYEIPLQQHQCPKVLFMTKLTSRNRKKTLAETK